MSLIHRLLPRSGPCLRRLTLSGDGERRSSAEIKERAERGAVLLRGAGLCSGDRVALLLGRTEEFLVAALSVFWAGGVVVPLFTALGSQGVEMRLRASGAKLAVTSKMAAERFPKPTADSVPIFTTFLDDADRVTGSAIDCHRYGSNELMSLLFTSGTTGVPKGVPIPFKALDSFERYMGAGLKVLHSDTFLNLADVGWAYGYYYNCLGPLAIGKELLWLDVAPFNAPWVLEQIQEHRVSNMAGSPSALNLLRLALQDKSPAVGLKALKRVSSAGEPLTAELADFYEKHLGVIIQSHYGQTEHGMLTVGSDSPTALGQPMPGFSLKVINGVLHVDSAKSPLFWFPGYWNAEAQSPRKLSNLLVPTGDLVVEGDDGVLHYQSRSDDLIKSSGYLISPTEIENVLLCHPSVRECGVVGLPDAVRGHTIAAGVVARDASGDLSEELKQMVSQRLGAHILLRHIKFFDELPKTESGKLKRSALKDHLLT